MTLLLLHLVTNSYNTGADVENNVTVAYTSDKGLCGGINSTVTKYTRGILRATEGGKSSSIGKACNPTLYTQPVYCFKLHRGLNSCCMCTFCDLPPAKLLPAGHCLLQHKKAQSCLIVQWSATLIVAYRGQEVGHCCHG